MAMNQINFYNCQMNLKREKVLIDNKTGWCDEMRV